MNPCLRGEMDDDIGLLGQGQSVERGEILQPSDVRREMLVLEQHLVPPLLQPHIVIVGQSIESDHHETLLEQQTAQVKADEAC